MLRNKLWSCLAGIVMLTVAASGRAELPRSGFLDDYAILKPSRWEGVFVYRADELDPKRYLRLVVNEVELWYAPDSPYRGIDAEAARKAARAIRQTFAEEIGRQGRLLKEPGPGVMTLSIAVTNVYAERPIRQQRGVTVDEYGPFILRRAVFEMMLHDSQTGELLAEFLYTDLGARDGGKRRPLSEIRADILKIARSFAEGLEAFYQLQDFY